MQRDRLGVDKSGVPLFPAGLRALTDEQLDHAVAGSSHTLQGGDLLQELYRRDAARREGLIVRLTWAIAIMTVVISVATVINVWVFIART